ncbi:type II secretion system protein GspM [Variovorax sp. RB2P76]|uniref:type II secretion system protein GspM n=1 Tax=Variovorax sp. RB2P76 TaxID=3443736 RepID=UPI003F479BA5
MQPIHEQVANRWRGRSQRERNQIVGMIAVVVMALVWLLLTKPALDTLEHWDSELPRLRSQAAALKDVLADVGIPSAAPRDSSSDLASSVRVSLDAGGLAGGYQVREMDSALQIEFERSTDASRVMAWLLGAPASLGMTVQKVTLQRLEDSGSDVQKNHVRAKATMVARQKPGNGS